MKFKSKPVTIEAAQFNGTNQQWLIEWAEAQLLAPFIRVDDDGSVKVATRNGAVAVNVGDYLIAGAKLDEIYPCSEDVFNEKYERAY